MSTNILDHTGSPIVNNEKSKSVTNDGLTNVASGLGGGNDKSSYNVFNYGFIHNNYAELEAAYSGNPIAKQIIDILSGETISKWRSIKCKSAEDIHRYEDKISYKQSVLEAFRWSLLYGGAAILMATGQDLEKPFNINKITKGCLDKYNNKLIVFDMHDLNGQLFNQTNPLSENYLEPEYYTIRGGNVTVHHSHFVKFYGRPLPKRMRSLNLGWGDSYLRGVLGDISDMYAAKKGISSLMTECNIDVFRASQLIKKLSTRQDQSIIARYTNLNLLKSNTQAIILDKDEEDYMRKTLSLSGVPDTLEKLMIIISAATRIPITKLFGTSAKGMSATGEGDLNNYYDLLRDFQENTITPALSTLDEVLCISATGRYPEDFDYKWNSLHQADTLKEATVKKAEAETHISLLDAGIINTNQIRKELQSKEEYQFTDEELEEGSPFSEGQKEEVPEEEQNRYEKKLNAS